MRVSKGGKGSGFFQRHNTYFAVQYIIFLNFFMVFLEKSSLFLQDGTMAWGYVVFARGSYYISRVRS